MRPEARRGGGRLMALYDVHGEKLRFLVVGGWNTFFSYALFAVLLFALRPVLEPLSASASPVLRWIGDQYYLVVQWIAWIIAVPQSTLTFKYLVFRSKGDWLREIARSLAVYLPLQLGSFGLLWFMSGLLGFHPLVGQLLTIVIIAVLSYLGHKNFTFKQHEGLAEDTDGCETTEV